MNKHTFKTAAIFSLLVFSILVLTMFFIGFVIIPLFRWLGLLDHHNPNLIFFALAGSSILIGTILSATFGKRPINNIIKISEATKEIAKGNFSIRLDETIPADELRTMAHNFNLMARELANTEMLRNDFIENVSHEFKTPVTAIEGYVTLLQSKNLSEEKKAEYLSRIIYNTKRLSSLTGNILLLSRLENQELEIRKENFSLDEQLRESILLYEDQWNKKNLEFDIELESTDYYGNKELLAQVWQNLLGNAIKFVSDNGEIKVFLQKDASHVRVTISDNGIGMNEETIKRIYEKFYQGDASHSTAGNGLGLALAKRIIDLHNGTIEASSKENRGSTFTVVLPL